MYNDGLVSSGPQSSDMQIANPIYDTVFKFLMEDTPSAILLLSTIIDLTFRTQDQGR